MLIYIKTLTGQSYSYEVEGSDTIESVKDKIEKEKGIQKHYIKLLFKNNELKNDQTFDTYSIYDEANIYLVVNMAQIQNNSQNANQTQDVSLQSQSIQSQQGNSKTVVITIKDGSDNEVTFEFPLNTKISEVKAKYCEKTNSNVNFFLSYNAKELNNDKTLAQCNITSNATFHMTIRATGGY